MADEYIKREYITEITDEILGYLNGLKACGSIDYSTYSNLFDMLCEPGAIPAADVRPVVFCENCIYLSDGTCRIPFLKSDESYCSWGRDYREAQNKCDGDSCPIHFPDEQPRYDPDEFFSAERSGK